MATTIKQKVITSGAMTLGNIDLTNYYTKNEIDALIPSGFITEIPSEYITESELNDKGYLTEHLSLEGYALKSELPDATTLVTKAEFTNTIGNIDTILDNINGEVV